MAHTPGPWQSWLTISRKLADVATDPTTGENPRLIVELSKHNNPNFEADARLIAAAPELLEACEEELLNMVANGNKRNWPAEMPIEYANAINRLRTAIAKAEGE